MSSFDFTAGDTVSVEFVIKDSGGVPITMSGATDIKWRFRILGHPTEAVQEVNLSILDGPAGKVNGDIPAGLANIIMSETTLDSELTWTTASGKVAGTKNKFSFSVKPRVFS